MTIIFLLTRAAIVTCLLLRFTWRRPMIWSLWGVLAAAAIVIATYPFPPRTADAKLEFYGAGCRARGFLVRVSPTGKISLIDGGGAFGGKNSTDLHADVL